MDDWAYDEDEAAPPLGLVPVEGRGSLPFALVHGESLLAAASWALGAAGATLYDLAVPFARVREQGLDLVVHDPLCPLVPAWFLAGCLGHRRDAGAEPVRVPALVAFRPVTDTIKTVIDERIVDTLDRDRFGIVASPVVFDHDDGGDRPASTADFAALAAWLRERGPVQLRKAPSLGRRVDDPSAVNLLECMDEMAHAVRET